MSESTVEAVKALLAENEDVTALVGTRIYPMFMPQNVDMPAIVLGEVSDVPASSMDGLGTTTTTRLQVDVYAKSYPDAAAVARLVESVLVTLKGPSMTAWREVSRDLFDAELKLFRRLTEFSVWRRGVSTS